MEKEFAEIIGLKALAWLAGNDELLPVFLGATGAALTDVKARAGDAEFLAAVLDFLTMDDAWVAAFCASEGLSGEDPLRARQALPGGALPNWT
ncbi:DUF3572 domain-containing protein [Tropicimonas marinistellae]|uniref:DUF3572 domain-containing protein n=1 Tax=Tropicimonas marinistellae TaxID=1739787 RepID=UPI0008342399|nr:DUF3572 domain-containing protein [Tropicimonas marinistellae]